MENITSLVQENKSNTKPELAKYARSVYASGKTNSANNKTSLLLSGVNEQEIIIKGEINPIAENKEEDFVNSIENWYKIKAEKLLKMEIVILLKVGENLFLILVWKIFLK